jgi:hypothetical protein
MRWDVATGIWRECGFSRTVSQHIRHDSQWTPYVLHSPCDFSLGLVTFSGPPIHRTLLQQTFLWGHLKAQVFTHALPDINSLKNAIRQEFANVTQDTLCRVNASVPGRWQQCLDCHGGHLQDVLKTWGFFGESKTLTYLTVFSCIYCCVNKCVILLPKWVTLNAAPCSRQFREKEHRRYMVLGGENHASATIPPGKTRFPMYHWQVPNMMLFRSYAACI